MIIAHTLATGSQTMLPSKLSEDYARYLVVAEAKNFDDERVGIRRIIVKVYRPDTNPDTDDLIIELESYKAER